MEKVLRTKLPTGSADFWKRQGLAAVIAHALHRAGIETIEDLAAVTREEFLTFKGLAHGALERCEALLGRPFPSARRRWMEMGLPPSTSWKLSRSRILTLDDLARASPPDLEELGFKRPEMHLLESLLRSRRRS